VWKNTAIIHFGDSGVCILSETLNKAQKNDGIGRGEKYGFWIDAVFVKFY